MEKVRIGVIGCGGIANGKHMPAEKKNPNAEMVAFCDIIEERAIKANKEYGNETSKVYTDYKELLKDKSIDAVLVLTHNSEHCRITVDALNAGKHVLCEKPMAMNYEEAKKMIEARDKSGKILTIGYQNRFRKEAMYLKDLADQDYFGEIYYAEAIAIRRRAVPTWGVFIDEKKQGGGPLIDIGTHALDLTLWMMNNYQPKIVVGSVFKKLGDQRETGNWWGDWDLAKNTVEDSAFGYIVMQNGAAVSLESSWALNVIDPCEAKTTLCGVKAGADMREGLRINRVKYNKWVTENVTLQHNINAAHQTTNAGEGASDVEARMWIDAVKNDGDVVVKPEQAIVVTRILDAIYRSGRTGKPVLFDDNGLPLDD